MDKKLVLIILFLIQTITIASNIKVIKDSANVFSFEVEFGEASYQNMLVDGKTYSKIKLSNTNYSNSKEGILFLPEWKKNIAVSKDSYSISVQYLNKKELNVKSPLYYVPKYKRVNGAFISTYNGVKFLANKNRSNYLTSKIETKGNLSYISLNLRPVTVSSNKYQYYTKAIITIINKNWSNTFAKDRKNETWYKALVANYEYSKKIRTNYTPAKSLANLQSFNPFGNLNSSPLFKIQIGDKNESTWDESGIYKVTFSEIENVASGSIYGININNIAVFNTSAFQLTRSYIEGAEDSLSIHQMPATIADINKNSIFDFGDYIVFYVNGANGFYNTNENKLKHIYHSEDFYSYIWIGLGSDFTKKEFEFSNTNIASLETNKEIYSSQYYQHFEKNVEQIASDLKEYTNWIGTSFYTVDQTKSWTLNLEDIDTTKELFVNVKYGSEEIGTGYMSGIAELIPLINNTELIETNLSDNFSYLGSLDKEIKLDLKATSIRINSKLVLHSFQVNYKKNLLLNKQIDFLGREYINQSSSDSIFTYKIKTNKDLANDSLWILDVTDADKPKRLVAEVIDSVINLKIKGPQSITKDGVKFVASTIENAKSIKNITKYNLDSYNMVERNLCNISKNYDYIVVSPMYLYSASKNLVEHRKNFKTDNVENPTVVFIEDIMDQFGGGRNDGTAIRNFLVFATKNWGLKFVVLMGSGSKDIKNYLSKNYSNFSKLNIPVYQNYGKGDSVSYVLNNSSTKFNPIATSASDDFYFNTATNYVFHLGRIPVKNLTRANLAVDRIIEFDTMKKDAYWRNNALMVADDEWQKSGIDGISPPTHPRDAEYTAQKMTSNIEIKKLYLMDYERNSLKECPEAEMDLISLMNKGLIFNGFIGHGKNDVLSDERLFTLASSMPKFSNNGKGGIFWAASCDVGIFDSPNIEKNIGEEFLFNSNGWYINTITASKESYPQQNRDLMSAFVENLFTIPGISIGEALSSAKRNNDINDQKHNLFGDPSIILMPTGAKIQYSSSLKLDTLKAMQKLTIAGTVKSESNNLPLNGKLSIKLIGPRKNHNLIYEDIYKAGNILPVVYEGDIIFSGIIDVKDGVFSNDFRIPTYIPFNVLGSRLISLFWDNGVMASRVDSNIIFSGIDTSGALSDDGNGPEISLTLLLLDSAGKKSYSEIPISKEVLITDSTILRVHLFDTNGINVSTNSIDDGFLYEVPGLFPRKRKTTINLQDGSYTRGYIDISLKEELTFESAALSQEDYELLIFAQDLFSRRSSKTYKMKFAKNDSIINVGREHYIYPNPFKDEISFFWNTPKAYNVKIKIFTRSGKLLRIYKKENCLFSKTGESAVIWNGQDSEGYEVANGIYIYTITFLESSFTTDLNKLSLEAVKTVIPKTITGKIIRLK